MGGRGHLKPLGPAYQEGREEPVFRQSSLRKLAAVTWHHLGRGSTDPNMEAHQEALSIALHSMLGKSGSHSS